VILIPAAALMWWVPLGVLEDYRTGLAIGWVILAAFIILPQRITPEEKLPLSRLLIWLFRPIYIVVVRLWPITLIIATLMIASIILPWNRLGSEFMPPLEEGDLLYMPTTDPGISMTKAREILQQTDKLIMQMPEVQTVFGKIGRAETATDPAPVIMIETIVNLKDLAVEQTGHQVELRLGEVSGRWRWGTSPIRWSHCTVTRWLSTCGPTIGTGTSATSSTTKRASTVVLASGTTKPRVAFMHDLRILRCPA